MVVGVAWRRGGELGGVEAVGTHCQQLPLRAKRHWNTKRLQTASRFKGLAATARIPLHCVRPRSLTVACAGFHVKPKVYF